MICSLASDSMPKAFKFELSGVKEIERALLLLPKGANKTVLRTSLRRVAKPIVRDAKAFAPRSDNPGPLGHMADSITIGNVSKRAQDRAFREGKGVLQGIGPSTEFPHAHLVEFGTGPRVSKSGKSSGSMPASGFMRRAFDLNVRSAFDQLGREIWKSLAATAKRVVKRAVAGKRIKF